MGEGRKGREKLGTGKGGKIKGEKRRDVHY